MPRLLLVTYHFPPEPAAGAQRAGYLATYLPEFEWDVSVLTRPLGETPEITARVVAAPVLGASLESNVRSALNGHAPERTASAPRRALRWAKEALLFPDRTVGWVPPAIARGLAVSAESRFDAVLSTAMPASVHIVAATIARSRGLPWIADYRDLWSGNPYLHRSAARARAERALERFLIRRARAITTISPPLGVSLERLHGRRVEVIPNAYDPREWSRYDAIAPRDFEFCYTGSLYDGRRSPRLLFEAVGALRREGDAAGETRLHFFGPNSGEVRELACRYGVDSLVEEHGTVARADALAAQRRASNLLILLNLDESTAHELGSKVYEYAGARRPIVAFGPRASVMREYLARHRLGWFASDLDEAKAALRAAHRRFVAGDLELDLERDAVLDARDLARSFAGQLNALI
jgi:glycosyltransferase involved in cell wall biosynthesis